MAINKVEINGTNGVETLIDLTGDTVTPETLAEGYTAHAANGELIVGTAKGGTVDMSKYFETTSGDTLTWDGNMSGLHNITIEEGTFFHVSDVMPTEEEIRNGGNIKLTMLGDEGYDEINISFTSDNILGQSDLKQPCVVIVYEGTIIAFVVYELNGTSVMLDDVEKTGIYLVGMEGDGIPVMWTKSFTINGYEGFVGKEVIKNEYLDILETTEGTNTLTWNADIGDRPYMDLKLVDSSFPEGAVLSVKISDSVPTLEQLNKGIKLTYVQGETVIEMTGDEFIEFEGFSGVYNNGELTATDGSMTSANPFVSVVMNDVVLPNGVMEKGVYFVRFDIGIIAGVGTMGSYMYASSVSFNGYSEFGKREVIKEEHLPDTVVTKSELEAYIEEALLGGAW